MSAYKRKELVKYASRMAVGYVKLMDEVASSDHDNTRKIIMKSVYEASRDAYMDMANMIGEG